MIDEVAQDVSCMGKGRGHEELYSSDMVHML